jgi:CBS domain-containing protein
MQVVTTHKNTDFDGLASTIAASILYPKAIPVLPGQINPNVKAFMKTDVITIAPGKSPTEAARLMVKYDIGRLPVVENENIIGILTRSDTMLYFYDLLPD